MWIAIQNAVGARQGVGGGPGPTPPPYTPPLDAYTNTVVAYSVRKLSSSYSGPCMQVRRASDSTTLDIGFDSNGLVKTADIAAFCAGSVGTVSIWYDQGSLGQNATATTSNEPTIYSGTAFYYVNGYPTVRAAGANVRFDDVVSHTGDWCNLFIMSSNSISSPFSTSYTIGPTSQGAVYGSEYNSFMLSSGGTVTVGGYGNIQSIHAIFSNASRLQYTRNAVGDVTAGGLTGRTYDSFLLRRATDVALMNMQEWIMWDSDLIAAQSTLETNLNEYYQVTNLPYYTSGFLADYSGAAAAYSVRKLSNTAIKALRVRRTVPPFDELDIGFTDAGDLDEAAIVAFGGSDVLTVSRWYDQSGQSNHAAQSTPSLQPQIYNGTAVITENGKPAPTYNGHRLNIGYENTSASNYSFFTVSKNSQSTGSFMITSETPLLVIDGRGQGSYFESAWRGTGSTTTSQTQQSFLLVSSSSGAHYENGSAISTGLTYTQRTFSGARVIGDSYAGSKPVVGVIQELIIYPSDQSGNRTGIETNINDYYTINPNGDAATSGFLFDYPGATFAYSIRQLNNNADYCMQVIRADGATLSIGFDGSGYVDTAAIVSFAGGQKVYLNKMYDQTGNQYHSNIVSSVTGTTTLVVIYDGTNLITKNGQLMPQMDLLSAQSAAEISSPTATALGLTHSLYAVAQRPSAPNALYMFRTTNTGVSALYQERAGNLTYGPGWTPYGIYTYPTVSNQPRLYSYIRKNGTDGECFNDGVSQGTTNLMNASVQVDIKGYEFEKTTTGIQADCSGFQEMIAYTDDRTAVGDNTNILANIKAYYPSIP